MNQFQLIKTIQVNSYPLSIDISPNGKYFLICEKFDITRWDMETYDKQTIKSEMPFNTLKIFKDSQKFVAAGLNSIQIYSLQMLALLQQFEVDHDTKSLSIHSNGNLLITSGYKTNFYDLETQSKIGEQCYTIKNRIESQDRYIYLNDMQTYQINKLRSRDLKMAKTRQMSHTNGHVYSFDICPKSQLYAQVGGDMQILVFDSRFKLLRKFQRDEDIHCNLQFTEDQKMQVIRILRISLGFDGVLLIRSINGDKLQTIQAQHISYWEQPQMAFLNQTIIITNTLNEIVIYKQAI